VDAEIPCADIPDPFQQDPAKANFQSRFENSHPKLLLTNSARQNRLPARLLYVLIQIIMSGDLVADRDFIRRRNATSLLPSSGRAVREVVSIFATW